MTVLRVSRRLQTLLEQEAHRNGLTVAQWLYVWLDARRASEPIALASRKAPDLTLVDSERSTA